MLQEAGPKEELSGTDCSAPPHPGAIFVGHKGASGIHCAGIILNDDRPWLQGGILFLIDIILTALSTLAGAIFVGHKGVSGISLRMQQV